MNKGNTVLYMALQILSRHLKVYLIHNQVFSFFSKYMTILVSPLISGMPFSRFSLTLAYFLELSSIAPLLPSRVLPLTTNTKLKHYRCKSKFFLWWDLWFCFFSFAPKKDLIGSCPVWDQQQPLYFYTQNPGITWHSLALIWIGIISCMDAVYWTCLYWILYSFSDTFC